MECISEKRHEVTALGEEDCREVCTCRSVCVLIGLMKRWT